MSYPYRETYMPTALGMPYRSHAAEQCKYELDRLEQRMHEELRRVHRYSYPGEKGYYQEEHEIQSYYYCQADRIKYYWDRQERYRDPYEAFAQNYRYQMFSLPINPPLQLENKSMPTEAKKYIVVNALDSDTEISVHTTLTEAETEAKKSAREQEDVEFIIFESKKSFKIAGTPLEEKVFV